MPLFQIGAWNSAPFFGVTITSFCYVLYKSKYEKPLVSNK